MRHFNANVHKKPHFQFLVLVTSTVQRHARFFLLLATAHDWETDLLNVCLSAACEHQDDFPLHGNRGWARGNGLGCVFHMFFNPLNPNSRSNANFSFQFIVSSVWYSMEDLAGDFLLGLKFV